jgi:hypothetical protein
VGEVLISLLDEKGVPAIVDRAFVVPPVGHIGPVTAEQRQQLMANSLVAGVYEQAGDRESAYERLIAQEQAKQAEQATCDADGRCAKEAETAAKAERAAARAPIRSGNLSAKVRSAQRPAASDVK